jgi:DNA-binding NarL/FixJ family response regulator
VNELPARSLRIVIVDDQTVVRDGLSVMLDLLPEITVVGVAANGEEALELADRLRPDAMLVDLHMPVLDGITTTRRLALDHPDTAVVVLTTYADDTSVLEALRAGARGYLTKNASRADIARALQGAVNGQSVLDRDVQAALLGATGGAPEPPRVTTVLPDDLTVREAEVLALIAGGQSNGDIAATLFLSAHTVKTHINRIFAKTHSRDRAQAILYAQEHGLAPRPGEPA